MDARAAGSLRRSPIGVAATLLLVLGLTPAFGDDGTRESPPPDTEDQAGAESTGEGSSSTSDGDEAKPEGDAPEKGKPEEVPIGEQSQENPFAELLDEIGENMKRIEEMLNQKETSASTQDLEQQTIEKIDELIRKVEACTRTSQSSSQGRGGQRSSASQSEDQKRPGQQEELSRREMSRAEQEREKEQSAAQQEPKTGEPDGAEKVPNTGSTYGRPPELEMGELRDRQGLGKWGNLPKRAIEQMYDNGNRKLPEKYRLILEEYWRKLPKPQSP